MRVLITIVIFCCFLGSCSSESPKSEGDKKTTNQPTQDKKEEKKPWEIVGTTDEFGDEVKGGKTIVGFFNGEMSNSATTNSNLKVKIQVNADKNSYISFFEYGETLGNLPNRQLFNIKIKKEDGETEFIEQFSMDGILADTKGVLITKALEQNTPLKVNVDLKRANQYLNTVYNFKIDPTGLNELLNKIKE